MQRLLVFATALIFSITCYSASGDIEYAAAVKAYKIRCQQGDYTNTKFEELKDVEKINIIGRKFSKPAFISDCKANEVKPFQASTQSNNSPTPISNTVVYEFDGFQWTAMAEAVIWDEAIKHCQSIGSSWSLPNANELRKLNSGRAMLPLAIKRNPMWAIDSKSASEHFVINLSSGRTESSDNNNKKNFVCVRDAVSSSLVNSNGANQSSNKSLSGGGYDPKNAMFTGGGYVPNTNEVYKSDSSTSKRAESYEERSKRIIRESNQYQQGQASQAKEEASPSTGNYSPSAGGTQVICPTIEDIKRFVALRNRSIPIPNTNLNTALPLQSCDDGPDVNRSVMIFFENGDAYWGPVINGKYQGVAEYLFNSKGTTYLGEWMNDMPNGIGTVYDNASGQIIAQGVYKNGNQAQSSLDGQNNGPSALERFGNWGKAWQDYESSQRRGTSCTSTRVGNQVQTNCY